MVHKKTKSKRGTARQSFKIIKNVAETHRKRRKEAKKNPKRVAKKKDPGIPNSFPFKEELLHTAKLLKEQKEQEKLELKQKKKDNAATLLDSNVDLDSFMDNLGNKEANEIDSLISNSPKIHQPAQMVMEEAQVLLHVLDARDPLFYRAISLEKQISKKQKNIFILNKIDLIKKEVATKWIAYLVAQKLTIVPFNSQSPSKESLLLLKSYWPKTADKKVGVIGFPLSGKTSLIKSLLKENDISFDFSESLLSIPGIIFSQTTKPEHSARVLLRNYKNSAHVTTPLLTVEALISRFSRDQLAKAFQVPFYIDSADLLVQYARKNQYLRRGGVPDTESAARGIIQDFYLQKFSYFTVPPPPVTEKDISSSMKRVLDSIQVSLSETSLVFKTRVWESMDIIEELQEIPRGYDFGTLEDEDDEDEEEEEEDEEEDEDEEE